MGDTAAVTHSPAREEADGAADVPGRPPHEHYKGPPHQIMLDPSMAKSEKSKSNEDGEDDMERCLRWAQDLSHLLCDKEGVQLFETFLDHESGQRGSLSFLHACNGLRSCEDPHIKHYMNIIYRTYIRSNMVKLSAAALAEVTEKMKAGEPDAFDRAVQEYEAVLQRTAYPRFLQSDLYVETVQRMQASRNSSHTSETRSADEGTSSPPVGEPSSEGLGAGCSGALQQSLEIMPTVLEEEEDAHPPRNPPPIASLTEHNVRSLYRCTDVLPRLAPRSRSSIPVPNPYHVRNSYFVPPSAQDSERHSMSSGAYTDDANTDVDSVPPFKEKTSHRCSNSQSAAIRKNASLNRDSQGEHVIIPRTQLEHPYSLAEKNPPLFANVLTEKLRVVKKQVDAGEKMERFHKSQMEDFPGTPRPLPPLVGCGAPTAAVASAMEQPTLCDRLLAVEESSSQSILDNHVSRVFDSPQWKTPPRSTSPKRRGASLPSPYAVLGHNLWHRKDRDACSSDSGAVRDYSPEEELVRAGHCGRQTGLGAAVRHHRGLSDSGVDSGTSAIYEPLPCTMAGQERVNNWICSNKMPGAYPLHTDPEKESRSHKKSVSSGTTSRSKQNPTSGVRRRMSSSQGAPQWGPQEMPIPSVPTRCPDTMTQLVEARRRLEVTYPTAVQVQQQLSKAKKCSKNRLPATAVSPQTSTTGDVTIIGYCYQGETVPYRRKVPGKDITLRQFKALLGKKGNYRYFFKRSCQEFGTDVVSEEISDDNEVLPLWEGKIFATIEPIE
ncbi:axin-2-like [Ornithodoros turicata]|uniref:axin-2-like n=1 Tax=Ornithodoros turicata TaxID=34597 RepID=UPI003138E014